MSNKSNKYRLQQPKPVGQDKKKQASVSAKKQQVSKFSVGKEYPQWMVPAMLLFICVVTFWSYSYSLKNEFTDWDDGAYVTENQYIRTLVKPDIDTVLFGVPTPSNYHPLTVLSLALNYHFDKLEPKNYYVTNIVIHLLNVCLVFYFFLFLFKSMEEKGYGPFKYAVWFAGLGALWQGIHPMHVESVSWVSERKDVLYFFFYLVGMILYLKFLKEPKLKFIVLVFFLFVLSNLSKAMAVVFPLSLFALDFLLSDAFSVKAILQKVPFLLFALLFGWYTFKIQKSSGSISDFHVFTFFQRIMFACYGFIMYITKFFVPTHLCSFYPYPNLDDGGKLPIIFYLSPLIVIAIVAIPLYFGYKASKQYFKVLFAGFSFYFFNVLLILQFISVGAAIMADRYSYVAYIGISFMVLYFLQVIFDKLPAFKNAMVALLVVASSGLTYATYERTKVWHSTKTLWQDVINKYPGQVQTSYKNLGNYYAELGPQDPHNYDTAFSNYIALVKFKKADAGTWSNIANIYGLRKNYDSSLIAYGMALKMDSTNFDAHLDRAITYSMMKRYDEAFAEYTYAYKMQPRSEKLLENRASSYVLIGRYADAVKDYNDLIQINPDKATNYLDRGAAEWNNKDYKPALADFLYYRKADPNNGQCLFDLAVTYEKMSDYKSALQYAMLAQNVKFALPANYINQLQKQIDHSSK